MSLSIHPEHLRRYRDMAWLLWKHGRQDLVVSSGLNGQLRAEKSVDAGNPETFARDLESLGPTFVKIGQLLASRADLLPPAYLVALSRLQDDVAPVEFGKIEEVINAELSARPSRAFSEIDPTPIAAASLAQVHAAKLRDGRDVVIKVQRPGIREEIQKDFEAFLTIARLGTYTAYGRKYHIQDLVLEFKRSIEEELDYRLEVDNLRSMRKNLAEYERLEVPAPIPDFCTARVLTMERVWGSSVRGISPVVFTEVDGQELAEVLFGAYLKQILIDGFFHADPHPGNVFLTPQHRLGLIDLGMVGRVDGELQQNLLNLIIAISEGRGRESAEVALRIGRQGSDFNRDEFLQRVSDLVLQNAHASVQDMAAGRVVLEIQQIAADTQMVLPRAMTLVGKTLLNLDGIARLIAPEFEPNASIRRHSLDLVNRRLRQRLSGGYILQSILETTEVAAQLPRRVNELLTQIGKSGIRLDVDAFDEATFISGFQKVANRITTGLVIAALIIGAALLMRIETPHRLFGYPALAMVLFLGAAIGGLVLLFQITVHDRRN